MPTLPHSSTEHQPSPQHSRMQSLRAFIIAHYRFFALVECMVILLFGWFFVIDEAVFSWVQERETTATDQRRTLEQQQQEWEQTRVLVKAFEGMSEEKKRQMEQVVPIEFDTTAFMVRMQEFATQAGATIESIDIATQERTAPNGQGNTQPTNTSPATTSETTQTGDSTAISSQQNIRKAVITITLTTNHPTSAYEGWKQLLKTLELFTPPLNVYTLSYIPDQTHFALQLETYYYSEKE